jgi:hypothetical protein
VSSTFFVQVHRDRLSARVVASRLGGKRSLRNRVRSLAADEFKTLLPEDYQKYLALVRAGRARVRGFNGQFQAVPLGEGIDPMDCLTPLDLVRLRTRKFAQKDMAVLGQGFLTAIGDACRCGQKVERTAKRLFSRACTLGKFSLKTARRFLRPVGAALGAKVWRNKGAALLADEGGRPKGCFRISDAKLREQLEADSVPRSEWSLKAGCPKRALTASKRQVWIRSPTLARSLSYRTLCRRLSRGRLGVGAAKNQTDKCEYCHWFDSVDRKALHTLLAGFRNISTALVKNFWQYFDDSVVVKENYTVDGFMPEASPSYLTELANHVERVSETHKHVDGLGEKAAAFLTALRNPDGGYISKVEGMSGHLKLRDNQQACYKADQEAPKEGWLYLHWDFQDVIQFLVSLGFCRQNPFGVGPTGGHTALAGCTYVGPTGGHTVLVGCTYVRPTGGHTVLVGCTYVGPTGGHTVFVSPRPFARKSIRCRGARSRSGPTGSH